MFDEFDDIEIDLEQPKSSIDEHEDEEDAIPRRLTISEVKKYLFLVKDMHMWLKNILGWKLNAKVVWCPTCLEGKSCLLE